MQYRVRGQRDQRRTIVERNDLNPRRQASVLIDRFNRLLNLRDHVGGLFGAPLHYDCPNNIVVRIPRQDTQPRPVSDRYLSNILHQNRDAVFLAQHDFFSMS